MAGVPPIPPLLCNTPPPIDFGEDDDDSGLPSTLTLEDDEYGDFALASDINEDATNADASSLPHTPLQFELSSSTTSGFTDVPPVLEDFGTTPLQLELKSCAAQKETDTKVQLNEAINYDITRKLSAECYRSQTTDAINELDEIDATLDVVAPAMQKVVNDNKQDNFDSNDAKIYTAYTESLPTSANPLALKTERESRKENTSILANEQDIKIKEKIKPDISQSQPVTGIVLIEDLADDSSDEECHRSPKKSSISPTPPLISADDIVSADFFAIHVVDAPSSPKEEKLSVLAEDINMNNFSNYNNNVINDLDIPAKDNGTEEYNDDFGDFADFESVADYMKPVFLPLVTSDVIAVPTVDSNENVEAVDEPPTDNGTLANNDNDDFDDFQDFCVAPTPVPTLTPFISAQNSLDSVITSNDSIKNNVDLKGNSVASSNTEATFQKKEVENDDDDDDDFGDFEKASLATPSHELTPNAIISHAYPPTVSSGNINERLSSVLKIMFPSNDVRVADDFQSGTEAKVPEKLPGLQSPNTTLPFESIETAKALEFQWPQSEMRHALIRSIGIDSRNILFGENWNPSMPRFAANLSFNPLKPMKPQTANTTTTSFADAESLHYNNSSSGSAADVDIGSYAMKTDVPEVEFDWQSAGLVNPLDGVKGEANSREAETIHPPPPVARLDTPDDQRQSHTAFTNIGDNISETLSNNDTEMTATPTKDICPAPLTLDKATYQLTIQEQGITTTSNSSCASLSSNSKPYDNSKTLTALRLGGNIVDEDDDDDGTVVTSTYAGPLKETHIYTPSKTELATAGKTSKATASGSEPIDFDYEIAAAGIIIDEKVVKKEYRDVEYNPGFSLEMVNEYAAESPIGMPAPLPSEPILLMAQTQAQQQQQKTSAEVGNDEFSEFTEFQSVPPPPQVSVPVSITASVSRVEPHSKVTNISLPPVLPAAIAKAKEASNTPSRTNSPSIIDNMILSPAILLPQAIPISANNTSATKAPPSIEWGDTSANINADELARIEELFPQPKMTAAKDANSSQKASPTHNYVENKAKNASISISASIAMKEQDSTLNDDYWSEFVSVPVTPQLSSNASRLNNNNNSCNINMKGSNNNNQPAITPKRVVDAQINSANNSNKTMRSPHHQQHSNVQRTLTPTLQRKPTPHTSLSTSSNICNTNSNINSNSNDDDWSDYVSSTPAPTHVNSYMRTVQTPQFNSAAWQNANFYNNPLGLYHQQATMLTRSAPLTSQQQQLQLQQQIHIMQDFSTAPVTARPNVTINNSNNAHISNMQHSNSYSPLQVGNARVAPSISLIPDLGFVAPAIPVHTAFVNVLPKTSFNGKK
ncbi:uncharacterized protein LOC128854921 isoform X2 [Anastrepha ludens]|nr:uncharacterized protein LOC128854921 isoform X2 [Anastrepha ludens]XP_053945363.1 uncharacterized protein LOC128854921 isoform X2 [Anastrepha ludens]XP_053945364.1 uncharacterized protein LOC128854921 isoform X2 [Anastrepha ludens]XP_053945365.1 uncharacterized protein LOC128854921 isoform X2 [Anastrepha ludens]